VVQTSTPIQQNTATGFLSELSVGVQKTVNCIGRTQWRMHKSFMGAVIQWHEVVTCIWYGLFVTSQFDGIYTFPNQRFGEVC